MTPKTYKDSEKDAYARISEAIINWRDATIDLSAIIAEAKERQIWKLKYDSWNDFCQFECGITKRWANKLIETSNSMREIAEFSERKSLQNRETGGNSVPTIISNANVNSVVNSPSKPLTEKTISEAAETVEVLKPKEQLDRTGLPIPHQCLAVWNRASEVQEFLTQLSKMRGTLKKAQEENDLLWGGLNYSGALADLGRTYTSIECAKPYAVCPNCQGKLAKNCVCCKGRGMVSQYLWDSTITREEKAMRAKIVEKLQTK